MNRTDGEFLQVKAEAGEAAAQAMLRTAGRANDSAAALKKALAPLKMTWGTSNAGQQCFTAATAIDEDTSNLIELVEQTAKTIRDNTAMGLATDKQIAANF